MNAKPAIAALKQHFENLFPGKWSTGSSSHRSISTGITEIDHGPTHGIARRRVTEWIGGISSGKTSLLRQIISYWCQSGLNVLYIDGNNQLVASDWAFVDKRTTAAQQSTHGKFWVVRDLKFIDLLWTTEQLIRSNIFDIVILETTASLTGSRGYARLQRALDHTKTALLLVRSDNLSNEQTSWACHSRMHFAWTKNIFCQPGLNGIVSIQPTIQAHFFRDGLSKTAELKAECYVSNRLFTHPQVPDRRASQVRARTKK